MKDEYGKTLEDCKPRFNDTSSFVGRPLPTHISGYKPDWSCERCGGQLGASLQQKDGEWEVFIPKSCATPDICKVTVAFAAEAMAVEQGLIRDDRIHPKHRR